VKSLGGALIAPMLVIAPAQAAPINHVDQIILPDVPSASTGTRLLRGRPSLTRTHDIRDSGFTTGQRLIESIALTILFWDDNGRGENYDVLLDNVKFASVINIVNNSPADPFALEIAFTEGQFHLVDQDGLLELVIRRQTGRLNVLSSTLVVAVNEAEIQPAEAHELTEPRSLALLALATLAMALGTSRRVIRRT
jgi:hypothetical protein